MARELKLASVARWNKLALLGDTGLVLPLEWYVKNVVPSSSTRAVYGTGWECTKEGRLGGYVSSDGEVGNVPSSMSGYMLNKVGILLHLQVVHIIL